MQSRRNYLVAVGGLASFAGCISSNTEPEDRSDPIDFINTWIFEARNTISSAPGSDGDTIYAYSTDNQLYAISLSSGGELWNFEFDDLRRSTDTPTIGDEYIYTNYDRGSRSVYALDKSDGNVAWERDALRRTHTLTDNGLFASNRRGLISINEASGEVNWEDNTSFSGYLAVAHNENVVGIDGNDIYSVNQSDGEEIWQHSVPGTVRSVSQNAIRDLVVLSTDDERVRLLNIETGEVERQISTDGTANVTVIENDIYYQDDSGLHLYNHQNDEKLWTTSSYFARSANLPNQYTNGELIIAASVGGVAHVDRETGAIHELVDIELPTGVGHTIVANYAIVPDDTRSLHAYVIDS